MNLTTAQKTALKTDANGRANLTAAITAHNWTLCIAFYNSPASPTVNVWRNNVTEREIKSGVGWQTFLALSVQLQNTYASIVQDGTVDATDKGTMHGLVGLVSTTDGVFQDGTTSSVNIRAICIRPATYLESLFSSVGAGTLATANICALDAGGQSIFGQQIDELSFQQALGF